MARQLDAAFTLDEDEEDDPEESKTPGWTFEQLDEEERKMKAYEQLLVGKEAAEAAWVDEVADGLRETSNAVSFGPRETPPKEATAPPATGATPAAKRPGGLAALKMWRAAAGVHGLDVVLGAGGSGRRLITARAFEAGEVLLSASPAAIAVDAECADSLCHACLQPPAEGSALRRCSGCKLAHYCSDACQKLAWTRLAHCAECRLVVASRPREPTRSMRLASIAAYRALRASARAGKAGPGGPRAVSPAAQARRWPTSAQGVLSLQPRECAADGLETSVSAVALLCARLLHASGLAPAPGQEALAQVLARLLCNAHTLHDAQLTPVGGGLFPLAALANHACEPSATILFQRLQPSARRPARGGGVVLVLRALRPLARGQDVTTSYVDLSATREERQAQLLSGYGFACRCELCTLAPPPPRSSQAALGPAALREAAIVGVRCPRCGAAALAGERGSGTAVCVRGCALDCSEALAVVRLQADSREALSAAALLAAPDERGGGAYAALSAAVQLWAPRLPATNLALYRAREALGTAAVARKRWSDASAFAVANAEACSRMHGAVSAPHGLHTYKCAKLLAHERQDAEAARAAHAALSVLKTTHGSGHPLCAEVANLLLGLKGVDGSQGGPSEEARD